MQFATSLIHWGSVTANDAIRDLGIYIYTTEQSAVEDYWFDMYDRVFENYGEMVVHDSGGMTMIFRHFGEAVSLHLMA